MGARDLDADLNPNKITRKPGIPARQISLSINQVTGEPVSI